MDKLKIKREIEDRESVVYIHDKKIEEKDLQSLETSIATSKISSYANNDKLYDFGRNIIESLKPVSYTHLFNRLFKKCRHKSKLYAFRY